MDSAVLVQESARLDGTATSMDALAASVPTGVDGGDAGAVIATLLSSATGTAAAVAGAVAAVGLGLTLSAERYAEQDLETADAINVAQWDGLR